MEKSSLLISVVIPMYNASDTIVKVLDSVKNQSFNCDYEVFVVNDGSTDDSKSVVEKYILDNRSFNVNLINQSNGGVSKARNTGLRSSNGDFIAFLDSDDEWYQDKIEKQIDLFNKKPEIDLLGCAFNGLYIEKLPAGTLLKINVNRLIYKNFFQPSTVIMKKSILDEIGYFDENQRYAEDVNYFIRVASKFNCYFCNLKVINYGDGKAGFGDSGLSANLKEMHRGIIKNLNFSYESGLISFFQFIAARIVSELKYIRRVIIVGLKK